MYRVRGMQYQYDYSIRYTSIDSSTSTDTGTSSTSTDTGNTSSFSIFTCLRGPNFWAPTLPPNSHAIRGASAPTFPTPKMFPRCRLNSQLPPFPSWETKTLAIDSTSQFPCQFRSQSTGSIHTCGSVKQPISEVLSSSTSTC